MFGLGEDIRMVPRVLPSVDVPCCVIQHPASNGAACSDRSQESRICTHPMSGPYPFNYVCMSAPIEARWIQQAGFEPLHE